MDTNTNTTATNTTDATTWWMTPADIAATREKVAKFHKIAARLGLPTDVAIVYGETKKVTELHMGTDTKYEVTKTQVTIVGTELVLPGNHQLAATLDIDAAGTIIRTNPAFTAAEVPTEFHTADATRCDHCGIRQHRKQAVVVWNSTDGFKQVGYTCVKPYLGISPASLFRFADLMADVLDRSNVSLSGETTTDLFVRLAALATLTYGFVKSGAERGIPTKQVVDAAMHSMKYRQQFPEMANASVAQKQNAADLAAAAIAWAGEQSGNEYLTNLRIASQREFATRNEGLLASLPAAYLRATTEKVEREVAADKPASEWLGNVGTKVAFTATVVRSEVQEGDFGRTVWFMLLTDTGSLVWYTTSPGTAACDALDAAERNGTTVGVTATVKTCRTNRKDEKVTVVTRAKAAVLALA